MMEETNMEQAPLLAQMHDLPNDARGGHMLNLRHEAMQSKVNLNPLKE